MTRALRGIGFGLVFILGAGMAQGADMTNGTIRVTLGVTAENAPCIASAVWVGDKSTVFENTRAVRGASGQVATSWQVEESAIMFRATASQTLPDGLVMTRILEMPKAGSSIRLSVAMENGTGGPKPVAWFPCWADTWRLNQGLDTISWWDALTFVPHTEALSAAAAFEHGSRLHSSDTRLGPGINPYWVIAGPKGRTFFGLDWCGGWESRIAEEGGALDFAMRLPENETQLVLENGESIGGPALWVTFTAEPDERAARALWMRQRAGFQRALFGGPEPGYPFTYNNWYTTRFDLDAAFLQRQVDLLEPYGFDWFIVDAGWYESVGAWEPNQAKFPDGSFDRILAACRAKGVRTGLWTCPQFIKADPNNLPPEVDRPGQYEQFIDGHLLDLAGTNYSFALLDHIAALYDLYGMRWWKYDQLLFAEQTRHGVMKNVAAFQDALMAVRQAFPDVAIENCQSGGRMINELTVLATQSNWLRDGGQTGLEHAQSILRDVLGAIQFLPPWTCNRWTNNPGQNDTSDDEFTRYYMRCAMPGTWGLVADLGQIPDNQRDVIIREVALYRRFNAYKKDYLYDVHYPDATTPYAGVTYYRGDGSGVAMLLLRMQPEGAIEEDIPLPGLPRNARLRIEDVDASAQVASAVSVRDGKLHLSLPEGRWSALVFIDAQKAVTARATAGEKADS